MDELLKESWRSVIENAPDMILIVDCEGTILFANYTIPGFKVEDIIGKNQLDFVEKKYHDLVRETVKYVCRTGKGSSYKVEGAGVDGSIAIYETQVRPVKSNGDIAAVALFVKDVSDSMQTRELKSEGARLEEIVEGTNDFISTANLNNKITYINKAGRKIVGLAEDEDLSNIEIANMHPEWAGRIIADKGVPAAIKNGIWKGETALIGPDGNEIPVSQVIMSHKNPDGEVEYLSTIIRDISELKEVTVELKEAKTGLEKKVAERTVELQKKNEEMQSVNEELRSTTEELQAANEELRVTAQELEETKTGLEKKVNERTGELQKSHDELQEKIVELEKFTNVALDRELRISELKDKVKALEEK